LENNSTCTNSFYQCLCVFRKIISHLNVYKIPKISKTGSDEEDSSNEDDEEGDKDDFYAYLEELKNLETLFLCLEENNIYNCIFDCEKILQNCTSSSENLEFHLTASTGSRRLSKSQRQASNDYEVYPSLKYLAVKKYTPQDALTEITYIKRKFPNLEELHLEPMLIEASASFHILLIFEIMTYLFSTPQIEFSHQHESCEAILRSVP
jgi:hypothetical protein